MPLNPRVQPIIKAMGGVVQASRKLGVAPATFYQWSRIPSWWVDRVAETSGIPAEQLPTSKSHANRKG